MHQPDPMSRFVEDAQNFLEANVRGNAEVSKVPNGSVRRPWIMGGTLTKASFTVTRANGMVSEVVVKRIEVGDTIRFIVRENGVLMGVEKCPTAYKYDEEYYDALDAAVHWC